jgi:23S rRNA (cytosine1962-C5)-methyltransferase
MPTESATPRFPTLKLDAKGSARVGRGHLWVFSNEIATTDPAAVAGGEVTLRSEQGEFLGSALYNRHALIAARVYTSRGEPFDEQLIRTRLKAAIALRANLLPERKSCRLVFSESDLMPGLIVDRYEDVLVAQFLTLAMEQRKPLIVAALKELLSPAAIVERSDSTGRENEGLPEATGLLDGTLPESIIADLNGVLFRLDVMEGQKTGLYLDQVENWNLMRTHAPGKKVLDLFSHVGGFALNASMAGAREVKAIDASDAALSALVLNAERNKLSRITAKKSDAFLYVRSQPEQYDVISCDPPPFAKSRKMLPGALRGYRELNRQCLKMLTEGGVLITCSCSAAVSNEDFDKMLVLAAKDAKRRVRLLPGGGQPADHAPLLAMPETHYLKVRVLQALD